MKISAVGFLFYFIRSVICVSSTAYWQVMVALLIARVLLMLVGVFVVITNLKKANNQGKVTGNNYCSTLNLWHQIVLYKKG